MEKLEQLRRELDVLDRQLLETASKRAEIVQKIGEVKAEAGRPLFDRKREQRVFEKARRTAGEVGLDPDVAHQLMTALVAHSHRQQDEAGREEPPDSTHTRHFAIVGGGGGMGRLLTRELQARGHAVLSVEKEDDIATSRAIREADIVVVSVPMALAAEMVRTVAPLVRRDALLCDVNSLKTDVCEAMARYGRSETVGLHPMFGPSVESMFRQKVVVCPVRPGPLGEWLLGELGRMGLELVESDPITHDRMMAVVQVLVHFSTLVMGEALRRTGVAVRDSLQFTSPIYRLELAFVGRLFAQSPDLYAEIEMANPQGAEMRRLFRQAAEDVEAAIACGDRARFRQVFEKVSAYFGDFDEEAMALSDHIIETLVAQP